MVTFEWLEKHGKALQLINLISISIHWISWRSVGSVNLASWNLHDPSQLGKDTPQPRRCPQVEVLSDLPGCRTHRWLGDSLEGPSWRDGGNVMYCRNERCMRPQVFFITHFYILWVFWTTSSDHTSRISLCGRIMIHVLYISQNIGCSSFLVSSVFMCFFWGNLIDAHIGTVVMPILQLLDLTCCSKACDAKLVVKLGD